MIFSFDHARISAFYFSIRILYETNVKQKNIYVMEYYYTSIMNIHSIAAVAWISKPDLLPLLLFSGIFFFFFFIPSSTLNICNFFLFFFSFFLYKFYRPVAQTYAYSHTHTHTNIHTYTHIHTHIEREACPTNQYNNNKTTWIMCVLSLAVGFAAI